MGQESGCTEPRNIVAFIFTMMTEQANSDAAIRLDLVGARGFEPPTPASRTQCATGLRYAPTESGNGK